MLSDHKKNILITGATGYLSGRIFQVLEEFNAYNFYFGCRNIEKASTLDFLKNKKLRTFDIASPDTFTKALNGIEIIINLASMNAQDSQQNPKLAQKINVDMVKLLLEEAKRKNVSRCIYMSTFHVYGPETKGIITEETITNPKSVYALTHLQAEQLVINDKYIKGDVIRLSNAFGAPLIKDISAWKLVVNDLCQQTIETKKMVLLSTGDQKRDFVPVSCIGDAIHTIIIKNTSPDIYNLGSEKTMSVLDMALMIKKSCEENLGFSPVVERKIDLSITSDMFPMFTYSNQKLNSLGFKIKTSLEEEIKQTLLYLN